jgi:hypothetical protein
MLVYVVTQCWRWPETLNSLEVQPSKILQQFLSLGDLRPGSISAAVHHCGKSDCHCTNPKDPGHEPQIPCSTYLRCQTQSSVAPHGSMASLNLQASPNLIPPEFFQTVLPFGLASQVNDGSSKSTLRLVPHPQKSLLNRPIGIQTYGNRVIKRLF